MNQNWRAFLESRSARIGAPSDDTAGQAGSAVFADAPLDPACALVDLSYLGLIAVGGPEAVDFLQGQVSNDLRELSDSHSQLSSHCSAKGRMVANFRVVRIEDSLFLVLPRMQMEPLLKRLRMFLLRAKATIDDASDALVCFGIVGDCADSALGELFGALPSGDNDIVRAGAATLIRVPGLVPRYLFIGPAEQAQALWLLAAERAVEANADLWALHDIRAGLPTVLPETSDAFVPQMANMQLIDGISFTKGCYTGQEVVARMQYLGKLKRRMYTAEVETDIAPRPGDLLSAPGSKSEQGTGRVVDARAIAPDRYALLVVVEISAAEGGEIRLASQDGEGPLLSIKAPPYGFTAEV
ncbi:MAG: folate-binding protein YgfZ [Thiohalocapsa sp.]